MNYKQSVKKIQAGIEEKLAHQFGEKAETASDVQYYKAVALMVKETLDGEMDIHKSYMKRLGITHEEVENSKTSLMNQSYTSYMLDVAFKGDALDILVAVLSCAWSYQVIGENHIKVPGAIENETFGEWIEGYTSDDYKANTQEIIDLVNKLGENITEEKEAYLKEVFVNCSRFEYAFWDMSYKMEI